MNILGIGESLLLKKSALNLTWCTDKPNNSRRQKVLETSMNYKKKKKLCLVLNVFRSHWKWERFMSRVLGKCRSMLMSVITLLVCPE